MFKTENVSVPKSVEEEPNSGTSNGAKLKLKEGKSPVVGSARVSKKEPSSVSFEPELRACSDPNLSPQEQSIPQSKFGWSNLRNDIDDLSSEDELGHVTHSY